MNSLALLFPAGLELVKNSLVKLLLWKWMKEGGKVKIQYDGRTSIKPRKSNSITHSNKLRDKASQHDYAASTISINLRKMSKEIN